MPKSKKHKPVCVQIRARWLWAPCDECGLYQTPDQLTHCYNGRYYCKAHCPECNRQNDLEMAGEAVK
jgi:hypothetical protein